MPLVWPSKLRTLPSMANAPAHNRITWSGTLAQAVNGGSEIFTFSIADQSANTPEELAPLAGEALAGVWGALQVSAFASLTGCTVEAISAAGKVTSSFHHAITPQVGGNTNGYPTILCNAVTLETATPNGKGKLVRGRIYPPATMSQVIGSTGTTSDATNYAKAWANGLKAVNDAGASLCVASSTAGGQLAPITGTSCDTIVDTQRRRKNHVTGHRSDVQTPVS